MSDYKAEVAACCIAVVEVVALLKGVDGVLLTAAVAALAGLGGYTFARSRSRKTVPPPS